jgi:hypothetical protein
MSNTKNKISMTRNRFIGCAFLVGVESARAQGFSSGVQNLRSLMGEGAALVIAAGLLVGLVFILVAASDAYKKGARGNDDITWPSIAFKVFAGAFAMTLGWVGVQSVETLGGSGSDIGRGI